MSGPGIREPRAGRLPAEGGGPWPVRWVPERMGYRPVMKAALLGVHRGDAARCCVSFTPSLASRSMLGVLGQRTHGVHDDVATAAFSVAFYNESPLRNPGTVRVVQGGERGGKQEGDADPRPGVRRDKPTWRPRWPGSHLLRAPCAAEDAELRPLPSSRVRAEEHIWK